MKKIFAVVMAVAFAFSVAGFAVAADNAVKAAPAAEKKAAKPKAQQVTGTIEALDAAAGTVTVKGKKGSVDLKVAEKSKVKLGDYKVGDQVVVKYADGKVTSVAIVKPKKAEAKPAAEKKADAPKAAPAAAPAATPAAAPAAAPAPAAPPAKK